MEVKANSDEGFDRTTLDAKVKETLHQTGTEIEKWEEKQSSYCLLNARFFKIIL